MGSPSGASKVSPSAPTGSATCSARTGAANRGLRLPPSGGGVAGVRFGRPRGDGGGDGLVVVGHEGDGWMVELVDMGDVSIHPELLRIVLTVRVPLDWMKLPPESSVGLRSYVSGDGESRSEGRGVALKTCKGVLHGHLPTSGVIMEPGRVGWGLIVRDTGSSEVSGSERSHRDGSAVRWILLSVAAVLTLLFGHMLYESLTGDFVTPEVKWLYTWCLAGAAALTWLVGAAWVYVNRRR